MQAALLSDPIAHPKLLAAVEGLPLAWLDTGLPGGSTRIAVTIGLSPGRAAAIPARGPHREILVRIDLPGDASIRGAGVDIIERASWVDELRGGRFEHVTCRVRHRSVTRELDLVWVLRALREEGLVADGDLLESIEVTG
ncbi:MAG: hypothetical protein M9951_12450 [Burkholderiaceae bacterium]|nr:hypothetical protein [Burkholderiaceae bacterium]